MFSMKNLTANVNIVVQVNLRVCRDCRHHATYQQIARYREDQKTAGKY